MCAFTKTSHRHQNHNKRSLQHLSRQHPNRLRLRRAEHRIKRPIGERLSRRCQQRTLKRPPVRCSPILSSLRCVRRGNWQLATANGKRPSLLDVSKRRRVAALQITATVSTDSTTLRRPDPSPQPVDFPLDKAYHKACETVHSLFCVRRMTAENLMRLRFGVNDSAPCER
jgi:hypothetical protein